MSGDQTFCMGTSGRCGAHCDPEQCPFPRRCGCAHKRGHLGPHNWTQDPEEES